MLKELGLDPLPSYQPPDRSRPPMAEVGELPLILVTGDREKSYHHSHFRDQPWALKVSPDLQLTMHPETALGLALDDGAWVPLEVVRGKGACRLRLRLSDDTARDVVNTGMGWWLPSDPAPEHGALDVNINAALCYDGPYDPVSGSSEDMLRTFAATEMKAPKTGAGLVNIRSSNHAEDVQPFHHCTSRREVQPQCRGSTEREVALHCGAGRCAPG